LLFDYKICILIKEFNINNNICLIKERVKRRFALSLTSFVWERVKVLFTSPRKFNALIEYLSPIQSLGEG